MTIKFIFDIEIEKNDLEFDEIVKITSYKSGKESSTLYEWLLSERIIDWSDLTPSAHTIKDTQ